ncbi:hypothetical protein H9Q13_08350 [Pontibacter sp. JH31]|uniref:Lipocalin-like domain-containing protein n=1 Tax=Pontibacter aquaedesilientis TaxID=2766980 RepID=A0ABR7XGV5_9BACT|nr:hypothetical protein [Pontibacter aquaedesilientis]MBD1397171.1 hypothetical protein [Pontibacter aquaedesilientis]
MKKQKLTLLSVLLFILIFSSCAKEDENGPASILLSKEWKRGMVDKNPATNPAGRILYYAVQNCQKDDTFRFGANKALTINQGANKCVNNEPATTTVSYTYNETNKELIIDSFKYTLAEESKAQIKYYAPMSSQTGYDYIVYLLE